MRRWLMLAALLLVPVAGQAQTIEYYGLDAIGSVRVVFASCTRRSSTTSSSTRRRLLGRRASHSTVSPPPSDSSNGVKAARRISIAPTCQPGRGAS